MRQFNTFPLLTGVQGLVGGLGWDDVLSVAYARQVPACNQDTSLATMPTDKACYAV